MEATPTSPPPQSQTHQQEPTNSYMLPAKIIFHQPQQQNKTYRPRKSFYDGLRFSPTLTSKAPGASPSENPSEKPHGRPLGSRKKKQPQALDSNVGVGGGVASSENPTKKLPGRLSCAGNKQKQEELGVVGSRWMPHLIPVNMWEVSFASALVYIFYDVYCCSATSSSFEFPMRGKDIVSKVMTFTRQGPRRRIVSIISASGVVCDVTLRKFAFGGGTVTYEGQFVIISLSGSFFPSESNGSLSITVNLSVSLSGPNNKVLCGVVSGKLKAASPVQVVLSSFILDKENPESKSPSSTSPPNMLNFGASVTEVTSPSRGASSNLADENGGSPLNHE